MTTPKLQLPELSVSQASKEITHNQALAIVDQTAQLTVVSRTNTPPGSPTNGAAYIVTATATGAWAGKETQIAYWLSSVAAWQFIVPANGWLAWSNEDSKTYRLESGAWVELATGGGVALAQVVAYAGTAKTLALTDINTLIDCTSSSAVTITIPPQSSVTWTADAEIHVRMSGTGAVSIAVGAGVTIPPLSAPVGLGGQGAIVTLKRRSADVWMVAGVTVPQQLGTPYATAGGTANAITLTTNYAPAKQSSLVAGHQVRARVGTTNTGATTMALDGLTAKTCVTVTGAALPAGYIRTDVDTEFTYDLTNDRWVVGRELESGSNANGRFQRTADGRLTCFISSVEADGTTTAAGALYQSAATSLTLPATFSGAVTDIFGISGSRADGARWFTIRPTSTTTISCVKISTTNDTTARAIHALVEGYWY